MAVIVDASILWYWRGPSVSAVGSRRGQDEAIHAPTILMTRSLPDGVKQGSLRYNSVTWEFFYTYNGARNYVKHPFDL